MDWETRRKLPNCDNTNCVYNQSGKCLPNDENLNPESCDEEYVYDEFFEQDEDEDEDDWEDKHYE